MELKHSFTVPVSLDRAWDVLLDVERVAICMPGASLDSVEGDDIAGKIKVKVGPITQVYAGKAHFTERDREAHVVILEASGRETRGSGTASATVRSELTPDGDQTEVTVLTNLNVTGKAAQFGRGVLAEVSGKLVGIFADNMAKMLAAEQAGASTEAQAEEEVAEEDQILAAIEPTGEYPGGSEADRPQAGPAAGVSGTAGSGTAGSGAAEVPDADLSGDDLAQPIEELALPIRAYNSLRRDGVHTVADLVAKTPAQLLAMDNIGPASVEDIRQRLADRGLSLAAADGEAGASGLAEAPAGTEALASANGSGGPAGAFPDHAAAGTAAQSAAAESAAAESSASGSAGPGDAGSGGTAALRPAPAPAPEAWQPDNDAVDLLSVAGLPVLKRALPVAAGVVALTALALAYRHLRHRRAS